MAAVILPDEREVHGEQLFFLDIVHCRIVIPP